jgi:DNA-binding response OmpR family regulator
VDDDRDVQVLLHRKLTKAGFDVVFAEDGISATKVARAEIPDIILLDVRLPGGDGFRVLERVRHLIPLAGVPIVAVSACTPDMAQRMLDEGADAFVPKPIDPDRLIATIHGVLGPASPPS